LKERDFSFPAILDHTNISVGLDDDFFLAYHDDEDPEHAMAHSVYWAVIEQMLRTGEPAFTVDVGDNAGETLRNAPLSADTHILTQGGYKTIRELVGKATTIWTGKRWAKDVVFEKTGENVEVLEVQITGGRKIKADPRHEFFVGRWEGAGTRRTLKSVAKVPANELQEGDILSSSIPMPEFNTSENKAQYVRGFLFGDGGVKEDRADLSLCCDEKKALLPYLKTDERTHPDLLYR
jgi:hypothetical protein